MVVLYVLLGLIAAIVLLFSVKITVDLNYDENFTVFLKVLFIKIQLLPSKAKKPKKEKPKEEEKKEEEKPEEEEEKKEEKPKKEGESFVMKFYHEQGFDGVMAFLHDILSALNTFMGDIFKRSFVIENLFLRLRVTKRDAAETALAYGKTCAAVYPTLGYLCRTVKVRRYDADIQADYLALKSTAAMRFTISVRPIRITNAVVCLGVRAVVAFIKTKIRAKKKKQSTVTIERKVES